MYRPGNQNAAADALSRREQDVTLTDQTKLEDRQQILLPPHLLDPQLQRAMETLPDISELAPVEPEQFDSFGLVAKILDINRTSPELVALREEALDEDSWYTLRDDGLLLYKGRLVVPDAENVRTSLIREAHGQVSTAHPGKTKTFALLRSRYFWPKMLGDITRYIANCQPCQRAHHRRDKTPGFLNPLPVPDRPWQHITMDFKDAPLDKHGFNKVFVVVDRFCKEAVSIPCYDTTTARDMAMLFISNIWRFNGPPETIVSDRGPQFISSFWEEFCRILGIRIKLSTSHHPQTDGQTEVMNQYLDQRLRPFITYHQDNWSELLPMMDYAQLTLWHESLHMSPFEVKFGRPPVTSFDWDRPASDKPLTPTEKLNIKDAQVYSRRMHSAWEKAKEYITLAQAKNQRDVNRHRREVDWTVKDKVYVSTRNWKSPLQKKKMADQWVGPYKVLGKEGNSWRIDLPETMKVHPVFAPDMLRKAADNPLPGQQEQEGNKMEVESDQEWEVKAIVDCKVTDKLLYYKAEWMNRDPDLEWYEAYDFKYSPHKVRDYHKSHPKKPGPPRALPDWLKAWEDGDDDDEYEHLNDSRLMTPLQRAKFFAAK
jgi:transposase InsO family protein